MKTMYKKIICIILILNGDVICASSVADSWILFSKAMKNSLSSCPVNIEMFDCLKSSSLKVFDKMITSDIIPLTSNARLERLQNGRRISLHRKASKQSIHNNIWKRNDTSLAKESWSAHVLKKFIDLFRTHTLNIDLTPTYIDSRARHRHRNQMLPMMIFGVTALGVITIPMGFQFLAVLGGKALLLAKMALMLAMMNGVKRVATSGVHYGLYHSDPHQHGYHYMDREDTNRPRSSEM